MTIKQAGAPVGSTHINELPGAKVVAWHFLATSPIPIWVARNFHDLGDGNGKLTHVCGYSVNEGEWIVATGIQAIILTDQEFTGLFKPLPK